VRVGHNFEHQPAEGLFGQRLTDLDAFAFGIWIDPLDGRPLDRAGQVRAHRVEQRLDANVLQRRPAQDRLQHARERADAQQTPDLVRRDRLLFDVFGEHRVVEKSHLLEEPGPPFVGQIAMIFGNFGGCVFGPLRGFVEIQGLHFD
jgi:hypothetical protein